MLWPMTVGGGKLVSSAPQNGPMITKLWRQVTNLSSLLSSGVLVGPLSRVVGACPDWDSCSVSQHHWCHDGWISPWDLQTCRSLRTFVDQPWNISGPATHAQTVVSRACGWHMIRRGEKAERAQLCSYLPSWAKILQPFSLHYKKQRKEETWDGNENHVSRCAFV